MARATPADAARDRALMRAGVEPNPVMPLQTNWAAPRQKIDGVYKPGAVLLAGDMLLEALNGDALARQQLKDRQKKRRQMKLRQLQQQKLEDEKKDVRWDARVGTPGARFTVLKPLVTRRQAELSSEQVGKGVSEGAIVHVLEMTRPNQDGVRRALIQDVWGKNSGWVTAVDANGEQTLAPVRPEHEEPEELDRGAWLSDQLELWQKHEFPTYDQMQGQQEKDMQKTHELQMFNKEMRRQRMDGAAGVRSSVQGRVPRGGAGNAFRMARAATAGGGMGGGMGGGGHPGSHAMWAV
jgi:hypothetical protein